MKTQPSKYLTRKEVLTRYGIGNTTLYRWIQDDSVRFPVPVQLGPRCVRWKLSELERWEAEREQEKQTDAA